MPNSKASHTENTTLFTVMLLVAIGGLVYELILGTTASYLTGDLITSLSLATGTTLFGTGIDLLLVKYTRWRPPTSFAADEIALGFIGGNSVLIPHLTFVFTKLHWVTPSAISLVTGVLIGPEVPLLVKMFTILGRRPPVKLLNEVLAIDYFGALVALLVFPLFLLSQLELMYSTYLMAALDIVVAIATLFRLKSSRRFLASSIAVAVALPRMFVDASHFEKAIDVEAYRDFVLIREQSSYQKIVITEYDEDLCLYLNRQLQFSSLGKARYHEILAISVLTSVKGPHNILVPGGSDGLLARELLKYPGVRRMTVVDINAGMTDFARNNRPLREVNRGALDDPYVKTANADAFRFVDDVKDAYDATLIDLVDPSNEWMAKLYPKQFCRNVSERLSPKGIMVIQTTSSSPSPRTFHIVASTVRADQSGHVVFPLSYNIPSFGEWGFVPSTKNPSVLPKQPLAPGTSHQSKELLAFMIHTQPSKVPYIEVSTLFELRIIDAYEFRMRQWRYY